MTPTLFRIPLSAYTGEPREHPPIMKVEDLHVHRTYFIDEVVMVRVTISGVDAGESDWDAFLERISSNLLPGVGVTEWKRLPDPHSREHIKKHRSYEMTGARGDVGGWPFSKETPK